MEVRVCVINLDRAERILIRQHFHNDSLCSGYNIRVIRRESIRISVVQGNRDLELTAFLGKEYLPLYGGRAVYFDGIQIKIRVRLTCIIFPFGAFPDDGACRWA